MSALFQPRCPVEPEQQQWVERRMRWLVDEFGAQVLAEAEVILPTSHYIPERLDGTMEALRALLDRVCGYMRVAPDRVDLAVYDEGRQVDVSPGIRLEDERGGTAGLYDPTGEKEVVAIEASTATHIMAIVATMAHELAHVHLLGDGRITGEEEDHEPLTDLTTVFFGMGVFPANTAFDDLQWSDGVWSGWSVGRQGYLDERTFAYALAVFACARGEWRPRWAKHLRPTIRADFKRGVRFVRAMHGDENPLRRVEQ